ncbi:MAG: type II secretion system F family protein [Limnohabitans sp.]
MKVANPSFAWQGIDRQGRKVSGVYQALSAKDARNHLVQQRIRVLSMRRHYPWQQWFASNNLQAQEVTQFARQLATLLLAGIPLLQCLEVIMRGQPNTPTHAMAKHLKSRIENGATLHQALQERPEFDALFCNLVQVGEMTGALDTLLDRVASHREKSEQLRRSLRTAMIYPMVVMGVAGLVSGVLLMFVVPAFESVYASFDTELPRITQGLIAVSQALKNHGWQWLLGLLVVFFALQQWALKSARLQAYKHRVWLHLPLAGSLVRQSCLARWTRTLATLLRAGIPLTEGLGAVAGVTGNLHYAVATQRIQSQLMQGQSLTHALEQHASLFQPMLIQMCAIGEESGTLDDMLDKAAHHFETSVTRTVAQLSVLVEPFLMVLLGLLVGGMVMALYLPIFQMGQAI